MLRFGPMCQYDLPYQHSYHLSLNKIIDDFYFAYASRSNQLTCYMHLQCNRGLDSSCLDWSAICNGEIECFDSGIDEEHCWQLEINQCENDEYRCRNGQCIPKLFDGIDDDIVDCVDASDKRLEPNFDPNTCYESKAPSFECEDMVCTSITSSQIDWTRSCNKNRAKLLIDAMYSKNINVDSEECLSAFKCLIVFQLPAYTNCSKICRVNECKKIVMNTCSNLLFFPNTPVLFGNIYFAYKKNDLENLTDSFYTIPLYICYNTTHYDHFFITITKILMNNTTCVNSKSFLPPSVLSIYPVKELHTHTIIELHRLLAKYHPPYDYTSTICNQTNMYQCFDSFKCISIYRLMDNIIDCPYMDDENITGINNTRMPHKLKTTYFQCEFSNKYIHPSLVGDARCDCSNNKSDECEDEALNINYIKRTILFQNICNRFVDLLPISNGERTDTDETECEQWRCDSIYTHCDREWNCLNGADESDCHPDHILNCSSKHHLCVAPDKNEFMCLPIEKANDGHIDCLGATDEPTLCQTKIESKDDAKRFFYCMNQSSHKCISLYELCNGHPDCKYGDDEQFCKANRTIEQNYGISTRAGHNLFDVESFLCSRCGVQRTYTAIYFRLHRLNLSCEEERYNIENTTISPSPIITISGQHRPRCHRGLDVRIWLNDKNNSTNTTCLCPPSYYGNQCQYQNQRISLIVLFKTYSDSWQILFTIIISLIDDSDQRTIHSYEQINYLSQIYCRHKLYIYLLYSTRPKHPSKTYAIHMDIYEKESLAYRGSLLYPIKFPFLPVHRLAFIVDIPSSDNNKTYNCSNDRCIHGTCIKYYNNPQNLTFCKCEQGWSGKYCTIQHTCTCSSDSSCIGISSNNQSICVCPINKFGSRCLLTDIKCKNTTQNNSICRNGGTCIPNNDFLGTYQSFACICQKGFSGDRCQIPNSKLILSFTQDVILSQSIFIHFFEVLAPDHNKAAPVRTTTFQAIPVNQDSITIYWPKQFHLVFIELLNKKYYLVTIQNPYKPSNNMSKTINSSDRCPNITDLFNQTFLQWPLIRRIKYYHLPCQNQSLNLSCFHDADHLCLCYDFHGQRLSNCFQFNHNMTFNCEGRSKCENNAQCLQDDPNCPIKSLCLCKDCYYGSRCQFSTSGFGLSLDAILGYHVIPQPNFHEQSLIIKISLALTILFMITGILNSTLCILTFKNKVVCEVGCGLYLLGTSITSLITMFLFGLKFLIFLLAQMMIIRNRTFLEIQCHSLDFILRVCVNLDQWLNACIATERAITVIKGIQFDKKMSKRAAKYVIIILIISIIVTLIPDPIHRHLIDEENEYDNMIRTWCIIIYPSGLELYDYFIHSFHFFGPFLINLIASITLITKKSHQQATIHLEQTYKEILRKQIRAHKHLLTAPIILVILAIPRLILTFISKCMKSTNDAWIFLLGYFISFIPSMLTFLIFIFPSKFYKTEFRSSIKRFRSTIQRSLHLTST